MSRYRLDQLLRQAVPMRLRYQLMDLRGRGLYNGYADRHKAVFVHVPKAAGTSIVKSLFGCNSRHVPWIEYYRANPKKFARYFKFAFVRNPWDRVVSAFSFLKKGGMNSTDQAWAAENLARFDTFEAFVCEWLTEETANSWVHFRPQHYWICDHKHQLMMDFVGRMESIEDDFKFVAERLGIPSELHVHNRIRSEHYSKYYTAETKAIVERVYATDIQLFHYGFEAQLPPNSDRTICIR